MLSNKKYKTYISISNTGAWEYYPKNKKIWFSNEYFDMLEMKRPHKLHGGKEELKKYWINLLHENDMENSVNNFESFLSDKSVKLYENYFRLKKGDGEYIWILSRGIKIYNKFKKVKKVVGTHININDLKLLEKKLYSYQKEEQIGTLIRGISHDFKNVLSGILGLSLLSAQQCDDNEQLEDLLSSIQTATKRGIELTDQILNFSKPDEDKYKLTYLSNILEEVVSFLSPIIDKKISINLDVKEEFQININPINIYQVILNLCTNAIKAINDNKGEINMIVSVKKITETYHENFISLNKGKYIVLEIRDSGVGIDEKHIEKIFNTNFSTKEGKEHSGIGLSVVYAILLNHNAKITVESKKNVGTSFKIYFPGDNY